MFCCAFCEKVTKVFFFFWGSHLFYSKHIYKSKGIIIFLTPNPLSSCWNSSLLKDTENRAHSQWNQWLIMNPLILGCNRSAIYSSRWSLFTEGHCLILDQTTDPSESILSSLIGSGSSRTQVEVFHIGYCTLYWSYQGLSLELLLARWMLCPWAMAPPSTHQVFKIRKLGLTDVVHIFFHLSKMTGGSSLCLLPVARAGEVEGWFDIACLAPVPLANEGAQQADHYRRSDITRITKIYRIAICSSDWWERGFRTRLCCSEQLKLRKEFLFHLLVCLHPWISGCYLIEGGCCDQLYHILQFFLPAKKSVCFRIGTQYA